MAGMAGLWGWGWRLESLQEPRLVCGWTFSEHGSLQVTNINQETRAGDLDLDLVTLQMAHGIGNT